MRPQLYLRNPSSIAIEPQSRGRFDPQAVQARTEIDAGEPQGASGAIHEGGVEQVWLHAVELSESIRFRLREPLCNQVPHSGLRNMNGENA